MPYFGTAMWDFRTISSEWQSIGMFDIILPMLLVFTIIYAVLQRTKIMGKKKEIDAVIALVVSFFLMGNPEISSFFRPLFGNLALGIAIFVVFLLLMGLIMPRPGGSWQTITMIGGIAVFFWVMSRATAYFGYDIIFSQMWWSNNSWWIIPLILIIIVVAVVVVPEKDAKEKAKELEARYWPWATHME